MGKQGNKGWRGEPRRHELARKGVPTNIDEHRRFDVSSFVARGYYKDRAELHFERADKQAEEIAKILHSWVGDEYTMEQLQQIAQTMIRTGEGDSIYSHIQHGEKLHRHARELDEIDDYLKPGKTVTYEDEKWQVTAITQSGNVILSKRGKRGESISIDADRVVEEFL